MIGVKKSLRTLIHIVEGAGDGLCGADANPLYHLGAMGWFFFWIVAATGIYLFVPYKTSATQAWLSIQYITVQQWYLGGLIRSLHRYASDALVLVMATHLLREFAFDRYHGARWFAWFSGIPLIWMVFASGITGYWLVWDSLAQYLAIGTAEWLDWLGIFGQSIARNFLTAGSLSDRFFTLLIFIHIALPMFLMFAMWVHILRISRPHMTPPKRLAVGAFAMLVALSLLHPATSHEPADLAKATSLLHPDWFFMALYPVFDTWGARAAWAAAVGGSLALAAMPWLGRFRRLKPVVVLPSDCNGCGHCAADCPFGAVTIRPRMDGSRRGSIAVVQPDLCTSCGICVASCPSSNPFRGMETLTTGIDLPSRSIDSLRTEVDETVAGLVGEVRLLVVGCDHGAALRQLAEPSVGVLSLPCTGMLPPSFIAYLLPDKVEGVVITGCRPGECFYRLGQKWTDERLAALRPPKLRASLPRDRIKVVWAAPTELRRLRQEIDTFRAELRKMPAGTSTPLAGAQRRVGGEA